MKKKFYSFLVVLVMIIMPAVAHEHSEKIDAPKAVDTMNMNVEVLDSAHKSVGAVTESSESINVFMNYHPLVVHFPIVLIIFAAVFQLLSLLIHKKEFSLVTLILLATGIVSAWLASNTFHAHPHELAGRAKEIFEVHEEMADLTFWFGLFALIGKIISYYFVRNSKVVEFVVTILMLSAATTVSIAGHHGAMLVHQEGVGPQGHHLGKDDDE